MYKKKHHKLHKTIGVWHTCLNCGDLVQLSISKENLQGYYYQYDVPTLAEKDAIMTTCDDQGQSYFNRSI
jgi:hypothetical protein